MTDDQQAALLHHAIQSRRTAKHYLHSLGRSSRGAALDGELAAARANPAALALLPTVAARIERADAERRRKRYAERAAEVLG